jgi:ABC-type nitrate/sulfonate/bicarbonate transport system permease component
LWATIVMTALVGILFYLIIALSERVLLRRKMVIRTEE